MKKNNQVNKFDKLVETLISEFVKIPNFDLVETDEIGKKTFNIITFRCAEIISYKDLVCQHFIPATNKAIFDAKQDFAKSKYRIFLKTRDLEFNETLYDTIRLAYVGLFHKLESYINDVIKIPELIYGDLFESKISTADWIKKHKDFDVKNWRQFYITNKINWICNCVKHKDGFPTKEPKPNFFNHLNETERIKLTPEDFKNDCELLIKFYPVYIQAMLLFTQYKFYKQETEKMDNEPDFSPPTSGELLKRQDLEEKVDNFIVLLKGLD